MGINDDAIYTPLFIDLIDDFNQRNRFEVNLPPNLNKPNDEILNYPVADIERLILKDVYGLSSLSLELKRHKPSDVSDAEIDLYMSFYFNNL